MTDLRGVPASKEISTPSGFVQCHTHNVRRKAECCEMKPILDADMKVIDYVCVCKHPFTCKSGSDRQSSGLACGVSAADAHRNARNGEGSNATPLIIDASSTSMMAHSAHQHHRGQLSTTGAASAEAGLGALFAVSFHDASRSTPGPSASATAAGISPNLLSDDGECEGKGDANGKGTRANALTITDSDADDADSLCSVPVLTAGAAPATAAATSFPAAPRARPRYYDSLQGACTGGHAPPVKVCWSCGMGGHEKPSCPNTLCRTCHQKRGPYGTPHRCTPMATPSPFIVCPTPSDWRAATQKTVAAAGEPSGMTAVRCVACNEYGHFDCSTVVLPSSYALVASSSSGPAAVPHTVLPTCCFCGVPGHTVFDCQQREQFNPDYFERRCRLVAGAMRREGGNAAAGDSFSSSGSYGGRGHPSQQQHQPRPCGSPTHGAPSSSYTFARYGNSRGGGGIGQRRERDCSNGPEQRSSGNWYSNSHREGGVYQNDSYRGYGDGQRRRYESPSLSCAGGGFSSTSSPALHGRDRFPGGNQRQQEERFRDSYGDSRHGRAEGERDGGESHFHGQSPHPSQQAQQRYRHGPSHGGGHRGHRGYCSDEDLF
ncbi:hypothetical protein LSCM1_06573 [Leishmania martiniquensis]|uniref:CCHC-type domain-containing protein n=1 Tax=Leishmania martiniquensis TaxID=1580590 RepID=A0A836GMJ5_9TRYP|nr:hypothetical protein LSCM1_06573 [Leishmania martiniquensis]